MSNKRSVLVQSPSHKCAIDFKVRGRLSPRTVKSVAGQPSIRIGNLWHPVDVSRNPVAPVRLTVDRDAKVPGLVKV